MEEYEVTVTYMVEVYNEEPVTMVQLVSAVRMAQREPGVLDWSGQIDGIEMYAKSTGEYAFKGPLEQ